MGHVVDRWTVPNPEGGRPARVKGPRHGHGKRWLARWVEPGGRERSKAFDSKDAAVAHLQGVEVDKRAGRYVSPSRVTFGEYADRWLQHQVHQREGTADSARRRLASGPVAAFGDVPIGRVTRADVQDLIAAEARRHAPATVRLTWVYTRAVFAAAVEDKLIVESPCRRINLPEVVRERVHPLSVDQVRAMADCLVDDEPGEDGRVGRRLGHLHAMFLLGAATGLRPGELRSITADRIEGDRLRVDRQLARGSNRVVAWGPLKTKASYRVVPLAPSTVKLLDEHMERFGLGPEGLVFHTRKGAPCVSRGQLSYSWQVAAAGLVLPGGVEGWHDLRHHHASLLIAAGLSPRAVADRLGHADPSETLGTYAHLWPSDQGRILAAIEGAYGPGTDQ